MFELILLKKENKVCIFLNSLMYPRWITLHTIYLHGSTACRHMWRKFSRFGKLLEILGVKVYFYTRDRKVIVHLPFHENVIVSQTFLLVFWYFMIGFGEGDAFSCLFMR